MKLPAIGPSNFISSTFFVWVRLAPLKPFLLITFKNFRQQCEQRQILSIIPDIMTARYTQDTFEAQTSQMYSSIGKIQ